MPNRVERLAMKRLDWLAVVFGVIFVAPIWAEDVEPPHIAVEGEAEVLLEPNYIEWVVDIRTRDTLPGVARDANKRILESLLEIADKADINENDIVLGEPAYEQLFRDTDDDQPDITRYTGTEVYRRVTLVMRDMDEFDEMLDAVHPLGVFYAVHRKSTEYEETVKRVEAQALKDARMKAVSQAAALGQNIGRAMDVKVVLIDGEAGGHVFGSPPRPIEKDESSAGPNGKILLKAYADVRFRLD